jgi:hypothetical protein
VNFTTECCFELTIIKEETISWTSMTRRQEETVLARIAKAYLAALLGSLVLY